MDNNERIQLLESFVDCAKVFHKDALKAKREGIFEETYVRGMRGRRAGMLLAARFLKGVGTGAYMANLPARVARRAA